MKREATLCSCTARPVIVIAMRTPIKVDESLSSVTAIIRVDIDRL
jgi:outer membrane cobalamin receptor